MKNRVKPAVTCPVIDGPCLAFDESIRHLMDITDTHQIRIICGNFEVYEQVLR